jgi:hypothetical protein
LVEGVMFTALAVVAGFRIPDSWGTKLEISLMALGMAIVGVLAFSLAYAFVAAPYEQRKALRMRVAGEEESQEATVERFAGHLDWGDMCLRMLESDENYYRLTLNRFSDPSEDFTKLNEEIESARVRVTNDRRRLNDWKSRAVSDVRERTNRATATLFSNHSHIALNRQRPEVLTDDRLWADMAGCLQWLAEWIDAHTEQGGS